jgi:DNA invertase Pin-like site-specific DNA recombinase
MIYCRISRDRKGAGLGVTRQEADCRELAARLGLSVTEVYVDNDLSAYSGKKRPGYLALLEAVRSGRAGAVLAWHTDRIHRSPVELEDYITASEAHGVPTYTVTAGELDLSTATGRMSARIVGAVARHEVEHQVERQQAAKSQAAAAGKWNGGRRPYGYEADGVTIRPAEAAVVAAVTDAVLLGVSLRSEVARLNAAGLETSTGRPWQPSELRKVLVRARNAGLREHKSALHPATWPPLVPEEKWRAVRSILTDPRRRTSASTARRWMLSNIATCGVCGAPLRVTLLASTRGSVPSYTCSRGKCVVRNAAELEDFVARVVIERMSRPDAIDLLRPRAPEVDVTGLRAEVSALRQRLDDLADDLALDERTLARRGQALRGRIGELEGRLEQAGRGSALAGLAGAPDVEAAWAGLHLDRRRAVVRELMTVTINRARRGRRPGWKPGESYFDPEGVEIEWRS